MTDPAPILVGTRFLALPLGTRFLYHGAMWLKLAPTAAQCVQVGHVQVGHVHYLAPDVEVGTA